MSTNKLRASTNRIIGEHEKAKPSTKKANAAAAAARVIKEHDQLISGHTVEVVLGISRQSRWRLARQGKLSPVRVGENSTRYLLSELNAYIAARVAERDAANDNTPRKTKAA